MTDVHLISSPTATNQQNTRATFVCDLPKESWLSNSGVCLKDLYFQSTFITVNKQNHPHMVFLVKSNTKNFFSPPNDNRTFIKLGETTNRGGKFFTTTTNFDFGLIEKTKYDDFLIVELVLKPQKIVVEKDIVDCLNFVLKFTKLDGFINFSLKQQKIYYKHGNSMVLFDPHFAKFLGFNSKKMHIYTYSQDVWFCGAFLCSSSIDGTSYADKFSRKMEKMLTNKYFYHTNSFIVENMGRKHVSNKAEEPLKVKINLPDKVIVTCDIVSPQIYNCDLIRYLGILHLTAESQEYKNFQNHVGNNELVHYQPVHQLFLPLKSEEISTLKISLQQENQDLLHLDTAGPTFLTLRTSQDEKMNCRNLVFTSSESSKNNNLFPSNKPARFFHKLPIEIKNFENNLGVKVVSMSIPRRIFNITYPYNKITVEYSNKNFISANFSIKPGHYKNITELIQKHRKYFKASGVSLSVEDERLVFENTFSTTQVTVIFDANLAILLGLTTKTSNNTFKLKLGERHVGLHKAKINLLFPDYILVYADFVESSFVGDCMAPVLKVIPAPPLADSSNTRVYYDFQDQNLTQVCKDNLSTICIELRDISGKLLEFEPDEFTEILLAFKEQT